MRVALYEARKKKGLSVKEVASKLGISDSFYYKIEKGQRNPTIALAKQISDLLGEDMETLFFGEALDVSSSTVQPTGTDGRG